MPAQPMPIAHVAASHHAAPSTSDTKPSHDMACAVSCAGIPDPAASAPYAAPVRPISRLGRVTQVIIAIGRTPTPIRKPPRRATEA
ncbi:hypothetical protein [Phaeovulum sp.]|uniref:hypothetical protein n=1 Tax=Phaeovulum sp. TaxID=2934796 RepID=UPI003567F15D